MSITATISAKPARVLAHGTFAESSSRKGVTVALPDEGFPALVVANPPDCGTVPARARSPHLAPLIEQTSLFD